MAVKVKALEWAEVPFSSIRNCLKAETMVGTWRVFHFDEGWSWWRDADCRSPYVSSEEAAIAAAQADCERRILSSIEQE